MSLLLIFHDSTRAIVAADDQVSDIALGQRIGSSPKFTLLRAPNGGSFIFAASGRASLSEQLLLGMRRLAEDWTPPLSWWPSFLEFFLRKKWAERGPAPSIPAAQDNLTGIFVGFDPAENRMRAFHWFSKNDFQTVESTADPLSRIICDGFWTPENDKADLQELTQLMAVADNKGPGWIAAQLRRTFNLIRQRHSAVIGEPCHWIAVDRNGIVALPAEFPAPRLEEYLPMRQEAHAATINVSSFIMASPGHAGGVGYNSGSLPGLAYNTLYYVYANDPALQGGNVTYIATTTKEDVLQNLGDEFLGSIRTPLQGAPDTVGNGDGGATAQTGMASTLHMTAAQVVNLPSPGSSATNLSNSVDGDLTTFATLQSAPNGSTITDANVVWTGLPGYSRKVSSATLKIRRSVANSLTVAVPGGDVAWLITYSLDGGNTNTILETLAHGVGAALADLAVTLPVTQNFGLVQVSMETTAAAGGGGSVNASVYEVRIEVTE